MRSAVAFFAALLAASAAGFVPAPKPVPRFRLATLRGHDWATVTRTDGGARCVVTVGAASGNGALSKTIYDKIYADQKKMTVPGFRPGTVPPQLVPRIRYAAARETCTQTVFEALSAEGLQAKDDSAAIAKTLSFDGAAVGDVAAFCKATSWEVGQDLRFSAKVELER